MTKSRINVGVIGSGIGARIYLPALSRLEDVRIAALCCGESSRNDEIVRRFGIDRVVADYNELAAFPDLDIICVTTQPSLHHATVTAALDRGKHVLCEKPFGLDATEAGDLLDRARRAGVRHFINHEFRLTPAMQAMKRMVDEGFLGPLRQVLFTGINAFVTTEQHRMGRWWFDEQEGGGWLMAAGSHRIDQFRFLFGEISAVAAQFDRSVAHPATRDGIVNSTVDDAYMLLLRFENGGSGACISSATAASVAHPDRLEAYGAKGTLMIEGDRLFAGHDGTVQEIPLEPIQRLPDEDAVQALMRCWLERIIDAIRTGRDEGPDFADGWRTHRVIDAARRAAREHCWVAIQ